MKNYFYLGVALCAICLFTCYGCEKKKSDESQKATEETVLKYLPGKWKVTQIVDESGSKTDYNSEEVIFEFGKQEDEGDFNSNHGSSLWGYCTVTVDGTKILDNGTWNIEPSEEDKGVFFYCQNGRKMFEFDGEDIFYITTIGSSSMRWENSDDQSGYILTRK